MTRAVQNRLSESTPLRMISRTVSSSVRFSPSALGLPIRAAGHQQVVLGRDREQSFPLPWRIAAMPHFQTVESVIDQSVKLLVGQQSAIAPRIARMRDDHHTARILDRGDDLMRRWRGRGNVILGRGAHRVGERVGTRPIHARRDQRVCDVRPSDRGPLPFLHLGEHIVPSDWIVLRKPFHHAFRTKQTRRARVGEHVGNPGVGRIVLEGEHMHGHIFVDGGDLRAEQQRQSGFHGGRARFPPSGGGVMVGDGHTVQAKQPGLSDQRAGRFRTVGKDGMAMDIPTLRGLRGVPHVTHMTIVSSDPRFFA